MTTLRTFLFRLLVAAAVIYLLAEFPLDTVEIVYEGY
jgi:hypothetical protein